MDVNQVNPVKPIPPPLEVNDANHTITVPHWGITLRTIFGAALANSALLPGESQEWHVIHKDAVIGAINVRQHDTTPA